MSWAAKPFVPRRPSVFGSVLAARQEQHLPLAAGSAVCVSFSLLAARYLQLAPVSQPSTCYPGNTQPEPVCWPRRTVPLLANGFPASSGSPGQAAAD